MQSIERWTPERVLKLPDHLFGERVSHLLSGYSAGGSEDFALDQQPLPDPCVLWSIRVWTFGFTAGQVALGLGLGTQVPGGAAAFYGLDQLMGWSDSSLARPAYCNLADGNGQIVVPSRRIVHAGGRRLVGYLTAGAAAAGEVYWVVEVSSLPREVPDWFNIGDEADPVEEA